MFGVCGVLYFWEAGQIGKNARERETSRVNLLAYFFQRNFQSVATDLRVLADGDGFHAFLASDQQADLNRALRRAVFFSRQEPGFDQIRFIDEHGREIVRVNRNGVVVPPEQLQDKENRPYFQEALKLAPGQIYISAFDLNAESGRVEQPFKPMLRFATPVFDANGQRRGVYVINFLGTNLLTRLQQFMPLYQNRLRVLNAQGYWILAAHPEQEWGFMIPDRAGMTLARTDPTLWAQITSVNSGQVNHAGGVFTWTRVVPAKLIGDDPNAIKAQDSFLIIASEISAGEWAATFANLRRTFSIVAVILVLTGIVILWSLRVQYRAEDFIRQNRALLQSFWDNTPAVVFLKDAEGRYLFVNQRFAQLAGRSHEEITGKKGVDLFQEELASKARQNDQQVLESGKPMEFEETIMHPDGPHTHLAVKFPLRDTNGKIYAVGGVSTDISERKRTQEELDRFFALSLDFLCIASSDGYFKRVSPAITDILGWSVEEFLSRPFINFVHPDDHATTLREVEKQVITGEKVLHFENRYQHKDGSWRVLSWRSIPQPGGLMYATARDMTAERATQKALQAANEQLQAVNDELEAFSYSVSHDLRAPVRHIDGFVKLLNKQAREKLDAPSQRYLHIIEDSARQMGALIDDLLVFSRMGRSDLRRSKVASNSLVHEAVDSMQTESGGRKIIWKIGELPEVEADAAMLRQVWINLVANAVKYTRPRDPAEIEVGCNADNGEFVFFVKDNGVGFDMQYAHKLFGVFQRLHRAEEFEGTGIGLANVRRIVLRHGGRTWAKGKLNAGATFFFSLPKTKTQTN